MKGDDPRNRKSRCEPMARARLAIAFEHGIRLSAWNPFSPLAFVAVPACDIKSRLGGVGAVVRGARLPSRRIQVLGLHGRGDALATEVGPEPDRDHQERAE
jgi:hypothetical protein